MIHAECKLGHGRFSGYDHVRLALEGSYWLFRALLQRLKAHSGPLGKNRQCVALLGLSGVGHSSDYSFDSTLRV